MYTAMVVKALAYEGKGELRRAESWLQTYLDLTANLSQAARGGQPGGSPQGEAGHGLPGQAGGDRQDKLRFASPAFCWGA